MSRIRSIKPEFFTSLAIAKMTVEARLLFIGLWTHCDDDGRCVDEPRLIKAALFPLDDDVTADVCDGILDELASNGRIIRYQVECARYIQIVGFDEHQKIERRKPSKHPSVNDPGAITDTSPTNHRHVTDESPPDLGSRIKDQGSANDAPRTARVPALTATDERFLRFWAAYPRKASKNDALRALSKALKSGVTVDELIEAIERQKLAAGDQRFVPYAATWLNGERWNDEPGHTAAAPQSGPVDMDEIIIGADGVAMSRWTIGRM